MDEETVSMNLSRGDAEVLLGVLLSERHNEVVQKVCDALARQLEDQLNPPDLAAG